MAGSQLEAIAQAQDDVDEVERALRTQMAHCQGDAQLRAYTRLLHLQLQREQV